MNLVIPVRFSRRWWLIIGVTTLVVGTAVFLVLRFATGLTLEQVIIYWLVATLVGDVITAISMEAVAPTRVTIGPGDRRLDTDLPAELAVVESAFDDSGNGRVRIHGETWWARRATDDMTDLEAGNQVQIVGRDGLTLIVSTDSSRVR